MKAVWGTLFLVTTGSTSPLKGNHTSMSGISRHGFEMFWSSGWHPAWPSSEPRSAISVASCRCASISPVSSEIASAVAGSGTDVKIMLTYIVYHYLKLNACYITLHTFHIARYCWNPSILSWFQNTRPKRPFNFQRLGESASHPIEGFCAFPCFIEHA